MILWLTNLYAEFQLAAYEDCIEWWDDQNGASIYFITDPEIQEYMDETECIAFCTGEYICFRDEASITEDILAHEMCHVEQGRNVPLFPLAYWLGNILFDVNPYEREAEAAEAAY